VYDDAIRLGGDVLLDALAEQKAGDEPLEQRGLAVGHVDAQIFGADFRAHQAPSPRTIVCIRSRAVGQVSPLPES